VATEALVIHAGSPLVAGAGPAAQRWVSVRRIMTDLPSRAPAESQEFYRRVVGLEPVVEIDDVEASVSRFIACDPDGKVVYVLSHL
jgi:hypothetical protein